MNTNLTKGAAAAVASAVLLLGGAGSLAYWNDSTVNAGTTVNSGHLKLSTQTAGDWRLNAETTTYNPATQTMVPGDSLKKVVTFKVSAKGDYLKAAFDATNPTWGTSSASALTAEMVLAGAYEVSSDNGATWSSPTNGVTPVVVKNGDLVRATLTITWPFGTVNNSSNQLAGLVATLNDTTVTVTQTN